MYLEVLQRSHKFSRYFFRDNFSSSKKEEKTKVAFFLQELGKTSHLWMDYNSHFKNDFVWI